MIFIRLKTSSQMVNRVEGNEMESPMTQWGGRWDGGAGTPIGPPGRGCGESSHFVPTPGWVYPRRPLDVDIWSWHRARSGEIPTYRPYSSNRNSPALSLQHCYHAWWDQTHTDAEHFIQAHCSLDLLKNRTLSQAFFIYLWITSTTLYIAVLAELGT
uniref:Uncharacterized protein n=1 Tax=Buteo japonicus TaxID=224669 RepID=A0A8C0ANJ0_9AVES